MGAAMQRTTPIDNESTVNEIVAQYPASIEVFNRFGIDSCCGGRVRVADAARRDGADADAMLAALRAVVERR
jgi:regulator of cell morphogenesis and NO signaling